MKKLTEEAPEEITLEELQKRFEKVESQSAECKLQQQIIFCKNNNKNPPKKK